MRKIIFVVLIGLLGVNVVSAQTILGANYNENAGEISSDVLYKTRMRWVRAFIPLTRFLNFDANNTMTGIKSVAIDNYSGIDSLLKASETKVDGENIKLILSFKYDFTIKQMGYTPVVGSAEYNYINQAVQRILNTKNLGSKLSILVVGNEPMWETPSGEEELIYSFTNAQINALYNLKTQKSWSYDLYVGAVNRISDLVNNPIRNKMIQIAKENNKIAGLDLHIHSLTMQEALDDVAYMRNVEDFNKKLISTEFSLVRLFNAHINDDLGNWGINNGYTFDTKLYEFINDILIKASSGTPITDVKFMSYFNSRSWYEKDWFKQFFDAFTVNNFEIVTYGHTRSISSPVFQLDLNKQMWVLNPAYNQSLFGNDSETFYRLNPLLGKDYLDAKESSFAELRDINDLFATNECGFIKLQWTDVKGENYYQIRRKATTTTFKEIATVFADVSTFLDTSALDGINYIYQVRPYSRSLGYKTSNQFEVVHSTCVFLPQNEWLNVNPEQVLTGIIQIKTFAYDSNFGNSHGDGIKQINYQIFDANDLTTALDFFPVTKSPFYWTLDTKNYPNGNYQIRSGAVSMDTGERKWVVQNVKIQNAITSIEAEGANLEINIYPNPTNSEVYIEGSVNSWELFNSSGYKLKNGKTRNVSLQELSSGIYFVKINNQLFKILKY